MYVFLNCSFSSFFLYVKVERQVDHFLKVRARKTNEMVKNFRENNITVLPSKFNSKEVERVSTYKYLRTDFDDQWKVSELARSKSKKQQQMLKTLD